jgi:hypothetical protein
VLPLSGQRVRLSAQDMQTKGIKSNVGRPAKAVSADSSAQSRVFIKKAREIGADEDKSAADDLRMAKAPTELRAEKTLCHG